MVSGNRNGLWFDAYTTDLTGAMVVDPTHTSGVAVCGFEAASVGLPDTWFCVYIGSVSGFIAVEIYPESAALDLRQYPVTAPTSHLALPFDVGPPRSLIYTVAWRVTNGTAELHVWYGAPGGVGTTRIHRAGQVALQANIVPRTDTITVGGTFAFLHQFVWYDAMKPSQDLIDDAAALDHTWSGSAA
jgi:hypothetical protein